MKKYRTLKSIFHEHDEATASAEAQARRAQGYLTGMKLGDHELFYVPTRETSILLEKIYTHEAEIAGIVQQIPPAAVTSYLYQLVTDEILSTNELEGVRSTRQEIIEALEAQPRENKRFREIAQLYLFLARGEAAAPQTPQELRSLYDELMAGELADTDNLDGELFRARPVYIRDGNGKVIHRGTEDEAAIVRNLRAMFEHLHDSDVPRLFSAAVGHFILEATHPFYDGNGRLGRFLLSTQLVGVLFSGTALTLSRKINEEKSKYYKAFSVVEEPRNYADATTFLIAMLEIIVSAQQDLARNLSEKKQQVDQLYRRIFEPDGIALIQEEELRPPLYVLGQVELFGKDTGISWDQLAENLKKSKSTVRKYITELEEGGLITRISSKPLQLRLSTHGRDLLFSPDKTG